MKSEDMDRRRYVRVSAAHPVKYRIIGSDDTPYRETDILDPVSSMEMMEIVSQCHSHQEESNRHMVELLLWIDWKLTYLIRNLPGSNIHDLFPHEAVMVDLSAAGMQFSSLHSIPIGASLQFNLTLPILPFRDVIVDAIIVRSRKIGPEVKGGRGFEMGVAFKDMGESTQDFFFRYVIKRERQIRFQKEEHKISIS